MNGYRYTVTMKSATDGETHAAQNLYNSLSEPTYTGGTVCGERGMMELADGQATCEKCIEKIKATQT